MIQILDVFNNIYQVTKVKKFPRIGPQDDRFFGDHSFESQFREILEKFFVNFPQEIPETLFQIYM